MAPQTPPTPQKSEIKQLVSSTESKVHSLKAAIFHTMAYKTSLEINKGNVTLPTRRSFLKVLYNVCQIKKKQICFEQYYRNYVNGPKIAICETTSDTVFVLNSAFTTKDNYFQVALDDAIDAFNAVLLDFGYTQQLQRYNPETHQVYPLLLQATLLRCLVRHRHSMVLSDISPDDSTTSLHQMTPLLHFIR